MLRTYASLVGLQGIAAGLTFLFLAIVAAVVPASEFGKFSLALSAAQIISAIVFAWTNAALLRFAREEVGQDGTMAATLGSRLLIHLVLLAVALPVLVFAWPHLERLMGVPSGSLLLVIAAIFFVSLYDIGSYAAQAAERFAAFGAGPVLLRLVQVLALGLFALGVATDWRTLMVATIVGYALGVVIAWRQIPRSMLHRVRPSRRQVNRILRYSWSVPIGSAGGVLVVWMDLWFVRHFLDLDSVGVYAWAYNVSLFASALFIPLSAVVAPKLIDLHVQSDEAGIRRYSQVAMSLFAVAIVAVPLSIGALIALFALIDFGGYAAALTPAAILLGATLFQLASYLVNPVLAAHENLVTRGVAINLLVAAINAAGNWILIPRFGVAGPAIATAAAFGVGAILTLELARRATAARDAFSVPLVLVGGAAAVALAAGLVALDAVLAIPAAVLISLLVAGFGRRQRAFRGLGSLAPLLGSSPPLVSRPALSLISWLDPAFEGPGSSRRP